MRNNHLSILNGDLADGFGDNFEQEYHLNLEHEEEFKNLKINKMQKSKIEKIVNVKPWNGGNNGTVYYHDLLMENGDKISIGKKKELAIGEELTYEITDSGQEYNKAKSVNENFQQGNFTPKGRGVDQDAILYQVCLKEASNIVAFDGWNGNEETKDKCQYITDLAYQIAVVSKENINKLKNK